MASSNLDLIKKKNVFHGAEVILNGIMIKLVIIMVGETNSAKNFKVKDICSHIHRVNCILYAV